MMKLHTHQEISVNGRIHDSNLYELAPGPDDGRNWAPDGAFFLMNEWERIAEPLVGDRIAGYDRYGRTHADEAVWRFVLAYLDDLSMRLRTADEPAMVHVLTPELDSSLRWELSRGFPTKPIELAEDLETIAKWIRDSLRRWHSVTVIGL